MAGAWEPSGRDVDGGERKARPVMDGKSFSVEEAASIAGCGKQTIHTLLAKGWISTPVGRPKDRASVRISEKSLFQYMFFDRIKRLPTSVLRELKNRRRSVQRFLSKTDEAMHLINRGTCETVAPADPSPYPRFDDAHRNLPQVGETTATAPRFCGTAPVLVRLARGAVGSG